MTPLTPIHFHDISSVSASVYQMGDLWMYRSGSAGQANAWINTKSLTGSYGISGSLNATSITASTLNASTAYISGSLTVVGPATFYGSASFVNVTASNLYVSESWISVNVFEPVERFGGLKVYDSGSSNATASFAWDSLHNHWVYQNASGSTYSGGMFLSGPRNTGSLGDEPNLTKWFIARSDGGDHLNDTQIYSSGSVTIVTGSVTVTAGITGSLQGTSTSASFASTSSAALLDLATGDTRSYALTMVLSSSFSPPAFSSPRNPSPLAVRNELVFNGNTKVLQTTASVALTASQATTASYAINSDTIFPVTAGKGVKYITIVDQTGSYQYVKATPKFLLNIPDAPADPSLILTGSIIASSITGSLLGTASNATTASYSNSASFATSSSYSNSASFATSASWAPTPTPGGSDMQIQFNTGGTIFDASPSFFYDKTIDSFANGKSLGLNGIWSHAEGDGTVTNGDYSHAEGSSTNANGLASHAEGLGTVTVGDYSHTEGGYTSAYGWYSHAEGYSTNAIGFNSHAEGESSKTGENAYSCSINNGVVEIDAATGDLTGTYTDGALIYFGDASIVGGGISKGIVTGSSFNGTNTVFQILGDTTTTIPSAGILDSNGNLSNQLGGYSAHAEGGSTSTFGDYSHAEGGGKTYGAYSHAEGNSTTARGDHSHAEGSGTQTYGDYSHTEGGSTSTFGAGSHAEGSKTISGYAAFQTNIIAAGVITFLNHYGDLSALFAPGTIIYVNDETQQAVLTHEVASVTINGSSETEVTLVDTTYDPQSSFRISIKVTPNPTYADSYIGDGSHAEGDSTITLGVNSHAAGSHTIAHGYYQSVVGQYNQPVELPSSFVIGDGVDDTTRHNLLVAGNGSVSISGSLTTSGSAVNLKTDNFTVNPTGIDSIIVDSTGVQIYDSTDGTMVLDSNTRRLFDTSDIVSINFDNRQLIQSDGSTVTLDWETGAMTGSFTGSFVGDGSGLTGVGATEYIRRSDYTSSLDPNVNYLYTGYAPVGSAESAAVWTLSRLAISASGDTTTQVTASAAWTDRYIVTYL